MNTIRYSLHTPAAVALWRAAEDALRALARQVRYRIDSWQSQRKARAQLLELNAMDAHMLRDLAIDRSELMSITLRPQDDTRARSIGRGLN